MARKTFISYKYSESCDVRDRIIRSLGSDAQFYQGETSTSPNMNDLKTITIKQKLSDMIYSTSVTIIVLSPNMNLSNWIDWEIKYSLRETTRVDRKSHTNGIICVVKKDYYYGYNWLKTWLGSWDESKLLPIIRMNRNNIKKNSLGVYLGLSDHYMDIVTEEEFIRNQSRYIDEAYRKAEYIQYYDITKETVGAY